MRVLTELGNQCALKFKVIKGRIFDTYRLYKLNSKKNSS